VSLKVCRKERCARRAKLWTEPEATLGFAQTEVNAMCPAVVPVCVRVASLGAFCTMVAPPVATALAVGSLLVTAWALRRARS
jgi:hypothetical protein